MDLRLAEIRACVDCDFLGGPKLTRGPVGVGCVFVEPRLRVSDLRLYTPRPSWSVNCLHERRVMVSPGRKFTFSRVRHGPPLTFLIFDFEIFNFSNVKNIFLHTPFQKCSDPRSEVHVFADDA